MKQFSTLSDAIETLYREYVAHPGVMTHIDIEPFFSPVRTRALHEDSPIVKSELQTSLKHSINRTKKLNNIEYSHQSLDIVLKWYYILTKDDQIGQDSIKYYLDILDSWLALSALMFDIQMRSAVDNVGEIERELESAISALTAEEFDAVFKHLNNGSEQLLEYAITIRRGEKLKQYISELPAPRIDESKSHFARQIDSAISAGEPEAIDDIFEELQYLYEEGWCREDLFTYGPREFEVLIADLWRMHDFEAQATKFVQDFGIDVVVQKKNSVDLIQAKQNGLHNSVGVRDVQRTAGLIVEFDADQVYVITSSSFSRYAKVSAARMGDAVKLINGDRLSTLLTESKLMPPIQ